MTTHLPRTPPTFKFRPRFSSRSGMHSANLRNPGWLNSLPSGYSFCQIEKSSLGVERLSVAQALLPVRFSRSSLNRWRKCGLQNRTAKSGCATRVFPQPVKPAPLLQLPSNSPHFMFLIVAGKACQSVISIFCRFKTPEVGIWSEEASSGVGACCVADAFSGMSWQCSDRAAARHTIGTLKTTAPNLAADLHTFRNLEISAV